MGDRLLEPFELYGWVPDPSLPDDDNLMDLLLLVTRASTLKQGSMACILLRPKAADNDNDNDDLLSRIQSIANNQELYKADSSDIHAEIAAIGHAARHGRSTNQCTAYITMPPCKKCFAALYSAGICRVVSVHRPPACYAPFGHVVSMRGVTDISQSRRRIQVYLDAAAAVTNKVDEEEGEEEEEEEGSTLEESLLLPDTVT